MLLEDGVDLPGGDGDVEVGDAEMAQRVHYGVGNGGRRADGGGFADTLRAEWVVRRGRHRAVGFPDGRLHRGRQQVLHEIALLDVAVLVVGDGFEQRRRHAHGQAAVDLALDDHGVDDVAAVVYGDEAANLDLAGAAINIHDADVGAEGEGQIRRIIVVHRLQAGLHPLRVVGVGGEGHLLHGDGARGDAFDLELVVSPLDVVLAGLQEVRGELLRLVADLAGGDSGGGAGGGRAAAGVGAEAVGGGVGVAVLDGDVLDGQAQLFGDDLGEGGLVALALGLHADAHDGRAGGVDADLSAVEHLDAQDVEGIRGAGADDLGEGGDADAHQLAAGALLGLLAAQRGVADLVERFLERGGVVAGVVFPAGGGLVRKGVRRDEVFHADVGGVHLELLGEGIHHPFDGVDGLGDAEGAAVGDAAGGLVGVDAIHLDVRSVERIGAGDHAEEAGGELRGVGGGVEGAVVGDGLDAQRTHGAVAPGGQLGVDVVVAGEAV